MTRIATLILAAGLFGACLLNAQDNPFSADARQTYALIKDSILRAAEKMPAQDYAFRSVPPVRTFGEMMSAEKHAIPADGSRALSHRARAFVKLAEICLG